ncbi:zinc finger protein ZFP2-like [Lytechinus pictus]|uniref:zinc finger protein ZFP2-like n=1 Tax=Lytechinus pictus TaxID=7653 RepID=UPI0030B9AFA4
MAKPKVKAGNSNAVDKLTRRPPKNVLRIKMGSTDKRKVRSGKLKKVLKSLEDPDFILEPEMDAFVDEELELSEDLLNQIEEIEMDDEVENDVKDSGRGFEKLSTSKKLQTMKRNPKTGQYECPYCVFCSPYYSAVASHTLIHTGEKPFRCKICGYRARQRGHVVVHMQMHEEQKPYKCVKCDYSTTQPSHLRVHMRVHADEEEKNEGDGNYISEQLASLKEQMKSEEEKMQLFSCNQCDYVTKRKHNLIQHLAVHTGAKPYKCDLCDYSSSQKGHLNVHIRTHTKEKPFKCPKCPFASTVPKSLREHLQMHYGQRPLKCPYCSFSSSQAFSIKRHIALHEEVKSFSCKFCSYKTTVEEDFNHHRSIHTQQASYKCTYCPYETPFKHIFDTHILTHTEALGITTENRVPKGNIPSMRSRQGRKNRLRNTKKNEVHDEPEPDRKLHESLFIHPPTPSSLKEPKASPVPGLEPEDLIVDVNEDAYKHDDEVDYHHMEFAKNPKAVRKQTSPTPADATRTVSTAMQTMPEPVTDELPPTPTLSDKSAPSLPDIATLSANDGASQQDINEAEDELSLVNMEAMEEEIVVENPMSKLFTCEYCDKELIGQEDWRRHVSRHFMEWPEIN